MSDVKVAFLLNLAICFFSCESGLIVRVNIPEVSTDQNYSKFFWEREQFGHVLNEQGTGY